MKTLKKILLPTDFSRTAKGAFVFALNLAKKLNATVKVIHIYRGDFGVPIPETVAYQMLEVRKEEALKSMRLFVELDPNSPYQKVPVETAVEIGFPTDVTVGYTKDDKEGIDLIIMGTKGEHNISEKIFGSVTSNVISNSKCPVLAVPEDVKDTTVKSMIYATDLKSDTIESIRDASDLAMLLGAKLHFVRVELSGDDLTSEIKKFNAMVSQLNMEAKIVEITGDSIADALDRYVHENGIDMILMFRPQRNFFDRIFHISSTKQVALSSSVPLLVFKK